MKFKTKNLRKTYNDEEIIERKLIFNTEEENVNELQRKIAEWTTKKSASSIENLNIYNNILQLLTNIEYSKAKSQLINKCCQTELEIYKGYQDQVANHVADIEEALKMNEMLLTEVKQERLEKISCHILAESIMIEPSRTELEERITELNLKIAYLLEQKRKVASKYSRLYREVKIIMTNSTDLMNSFDEPHKL